jgi:hypothetical protein
VNRFPEFQRWVDAQGKPTLEAIRYLEQIQRLEIELRELIAALDARITDLE